MIRKAGASSAGRTSEDVHVAWIPTSKASRAVPDGKACNSVQSCSKNSEGAATEGKLRGCFCDRPVLEELGYNPSLLPWDARARAVEAFICAQVGSSKPSYRAGRLEGWAR